MNGVTTLFVNGWYGVRRGTPDQATTYYQLAGQRVEMNDNGTVRYLLTDHLGSTSKTINSNATVYGELR